MEESLQTGQDLSGLEESQVRLHEALLQHLVLVMAALAVCVVTTATTRHRTDTQATPPTRPDQAPPTDPGPIPLTVVEIKRLFNAVTSHTPTLEQAAHGSAWRRRHQARTRWFHHRTHLSTTNIQLN
ncbi:hypothetical protein B0I32_14041 [Nonomuraea fuscirosea]|uniref:Uncharacterized protein n=1 Tax=Nonomuraea fuscirosea TaxID=1291556 RepID=A0A2T0LXP6_9ACTN|nr:hypothetical protein [Nonomuraea fuscirosea]PRX48796.1 hypothetical protein B0I32_14041 [Nonomuraea fuscirosea]